MENNELQALWNLVKKWLNQYELLEVAKQFPQFTEEARNLANLAKERERSEFEFEDHMRAIGNDRL